jgi:uroporphyrinogen-III synthase
MDYASELAEIITLIYNKESYTFLAEICGRKPYQKHWKPKGLRLMK